MAGFSIEVSNKTVPGALFDFVEVDMRSLDEQVLKVAKEIVAKFIEVGRVSPGSFDENFKSVYKTVREAIVSYSVEDEE